MLQPNDRRHLFESLRPPEGYSLDYAIGTTFTLDLLALLTAPLAFTTFEWADEEGHLTHSPQALLATMQQYADRITLFCQTGKIAIPQKHTELYSYLESSVVEVNAPQSGGIFHPKVWVLRFIAPNCPVLYRFLCLSRNLTFDQSWDTMLLLDGQLLEGEESAASRSLSDFIMALPQLAHCASLAKRIKTQIEQMGAELQRVRFELPPGFEQLVFHPLGLSGKPKPFAGRIDRLLIVSPFVSEKRLNQFGNHAKGSILISRSEELDSIPATTLGLFDQLYQISPAANPEEVDETKDAPTYTPLVGLHAKLYVADSGQNARIWTGSANATDAAFERNVELLVELIGDKKQVGIDSLLAVHDHEVSFRSLLEPFTPLPELVVIDCTLADLAHRAECELLKLRLTAYVLPIQESDQYVLQLQLEGNESPQFESNIEVRCYPMTRPELAAVLVAPIETKLEFKPLTCQALTSFFAFEIWTSTGAQKLSSFMLNVPLHGVPANRRQHILRSLLKDKDRVLKLLFLLLAEGKADTRELLNAFSFAESIVDDPNGITNSRSTPSLFPLFEAMVRTLDRNPMKLEHIARLVNDLQQLPLDEQLLPDQFDSIWQPIDAVRQRLNP